MSAFFVSRQTIHDAAQAWIEAHPQPRGLSPVNCIGRALWKMNAEALRQRYNLDGTDELAGYVRCASAYVFVQPQNLSRAQMAKSVRCLRYQCSEGDIGEGNPDWDLTYEYLSRIADDLGEPEGFDEATWDREEVCQTWLRQRRRKQRAGRL